MAFAALEFRRFADNLRNYPFMLSFAFRHEFDDGQTVEFIPEIMQPLGFDELEILRRAWRRECYQLASAGRRETARAGRGVSRIGGP